ncbi:MAG: hypothetical protein GY918_08360 [Gammaproteobacteria bacterium]|nr:hypothetical protein [Gammaproteobacteria bacterium]
MAETETVNPEQGTEPVEQDGSIDSAAQAILQADEKQDEDYESPRPNEPEQKDDGVDAGVEDEVEEEDQTDTPLYTVKVDGKEVDVTLDELQSGYLKDSDYRKKTGEIAEQRRAMDAQAQAIQQERAQYAQALGQMQSEAERQLNEYKQIDWNRLREDDPMLFMQRRDEQRELEKSIEDGHKQQQHLAHQAQNYQVHQFNHNVETGKEKLLSVMPDWDDAMSKSVREYGLGEGFTNEELSTLTDHRSMVMLRKAMMYDKIQRSQPARKKVKADTPKYVKSGVAKSKGDVSAKKRADKTKQLRKSGSVDDAASMIYDML